jgi:transposase-like protein
MTKTRRSQKKYSEELKHAACKAVLYDGLSVSGARKKFDIRASSAISQWMYQLGYKGDVPVPKTSTRTRFSESLKKKISFQVHSGELTLTEAGRKYGIRSLTSIGQWLEKYPFRSEIYKETGLELTRTDIFKELTNTKMPKEENIEALKSEIDSLKKELEQALLEAEVNAKVVEIASKELGIDIRKKSNTKQSKR